MQKPKQFKLELPVPKLGQESRFFMIAEENFNVEAAQKLWGCARAAYFSSTTLKIVAIEGRIRQAIFEKKQTLILGNADFGSDLESIEIVKRLRNSGFSVRENTNNCCYVIEGWAT